MNLFVICLLAVSSMSMLPSQVDGGGAPSTDVKAPAAVAAAAAPLGEIWQEDDREVLIRNVRGAKNKDAQTGSASGKKGHGNGGGGGGGGKHGKNKNHHHHQHQHRKTAAVAETSPSALLPESKEPTSANRGLHKSPKQNQNTPPHDQNRSCRYAKSQWSECDAKTNQRTRTLTLKRGESGCVQTRTIQKKCKKACRYEKAAWSECVGGKMTRVDKLRTNTAEVAAGATAPVCEPTRNVQKNCNPGKKERKQKDKGARKARV